MEEESGLVAPIVVTRPGFETDRGPPPASPADDTDEVEVLVPPPAAAPKTQQQSHQEFWDEDEFEGLPEEPAVDRPAEHFQGGSSHSDSSSQASRKHPARSGPQTYYVEVACVLFLIAFAFAYFVGRKENEKIALAWAAQYACKDGIFDKNFSLLGTGMEADAPLLIKEGQNVFKFYASGRRYCAGLLATMDLQSRHDLITSMWYFVSSRKDELTIDVFMNDENMEPVTFALVRKKHAKAMQKEWRDLQLYAATQSQRKWLSDELAILSESRELAHDLLTDAVLDQVFSEKAFEKYGRDFVSLHFTDQFPLGSHKKILQFKFTLPPASRMGDMSRLIVLVPYYIDLLGRYKLTAQLRAKAELSRAKVAQEAFKETQSARQEALQKKKEEKRKALETSESRLSVEALRKRDEKERQRQLKKTMPRVKMTRA